jgi:hypothetical protein
MPEIERIDCSKPGKHVYVEGFIGDDYWRVLFAFPILTAIIQTILMLTVYKYDTPKYLK